MLRASYFHLHLLSLAAPTSWIGFFCGRSQRLTGTRIGRSGVDHSLHSCGEAATG